MSPPRAAPAPGAVPAADRLEIEPQASRRLARRETGQVHPPAEDPFAFAASYQKLMGGEELFAEPAPPASGLDVSA
ncbi:MAG: hypothetical protein AB1726_04000 [Planctomycetota bacterium]